MLRQPKALPGAMARATRPPKPLGDLIFEGIYRGCGMCCIENKFFIPLGDPVYLRAFSLFGAAVRQLTGAVVVDFEGGVCPQLKAKPLSCGCYENRPEVCGIFPLALIPYSSGNLVALQGTCQVIKNLHAAGYTYFYLSELISNGIPLVPLLGPSLVALLSAKGTDYRNAGFIDSPNGLILPIAMSRRE